MTTFDQARAVRDEGMQQALDHAHDVDESWPERAFRHLIDYAEVNACFISHDVTEGLPSPTTDKAGGPIFQRAVKVGLIVKVGYKPSPRRHLSPTPLWESCIYRSAEEVR